MDTLYKISQEHIELFECKKQSSIEFLEANSNDTNQVINLCEKVGLLGRIVSVQQPVHSAELNSKNFKVTFESGEKILLRRCSKFQGLERYTSMDKMFKALRIGGVSTPEFVTTISEMKIPYFDVTSELSSEKASWIFFKYIEAKWCFSGNNNELIDAVEQIGKMHACLKSAYLQELAIPMNAFQVDARLGPSLTPEEWREYTTIIENKTNPDHYDKLFLENHHTIEIAIRFVSENFHLLENQEDLQNIHFDLNSTNFLVDIADRVIIMDYDTVQIGNVYTDIGFAFHRLLTTCIEGGNTNIPELIGKFLNSYKIGNNDLDINVDKLIVATYNRALRNIRSNLSLKYKEKDENWLSSIPININRLKQVEFLCNEIQKISLIQNT